MKIYKIKQMSGTEVVIVGKDQLDAVVAAANKGVRLIVTKYGVVNPASIDSIVLHTALMGEIAEQMRYQLTAEQAIARVLGSLPAIDEEQKKLTTGK